MGQHGPRPACLAQPNRGKPHIMTDNEIIHNYGKLVEYMSSIVGCILYPEEFLPASKNKIKELLTLLTLQQPETKDICEANIALLDNFIPFKDALIAAKGWNELQKMQNKQGYAKKAVEEYFKIIKKYLKP